MKFVKFLKANKKWIFVLIITVISFDLMHKIGNIERGYNAIGCEIFVLLIPLFVWLYPSFKKDFKEVILKIKAEDKTNEIKTINKWNKIDKIKIEQVEGKIKVPTRYVYAECPNCNNCFIMVCTIQYKYCPNCNSKIESGD